MTHVEEESSEEPSSSYEDRTYEQYCNAYCAVLTITILVINSYELKVSSITRRRKDMNRTVFRFILVECRFIIHFTVNI